MAGGVLELSKTWLLEGEFGFPEMCGFGKTQLCTDLPKMYIYWSIKSIMMHMIKII